MDVDGSLFESSLQGWQGEVTAINLVPIEIKSWTAAMISLERKKKNMERNPGESEKSQEAVGVGREAERKDEGL